MLLQVRGKCLALLANSNTHKITFLLRLSYTKRQVFFPSSAPSFFSSPLSRTQWWTLYDGCPEALEWILSRTGLHPPSALYAAYCTGLNCLTVAEEEMPPPPSSSQKGSQVIQGFSLPFHSVYLDILLSFSFFLCHTELPLWCNSTHFWEPSEGAS